MTGIDVIKLCVPLFCSWGIATLVTRHFGPHYSRIHHYGIISFFVTFCIVFGLWKCYTEFSYYRYKQEQRRLKRDPNADQ